MTDTFTNIIHNPQKGIPPSILNAVYGITTKSSNENGGGSNITYLVRDIFPGSEDPLQSTAVSAGYRSADTGMISENGRAIFSGTGGTLQYYDEDESSGFNRVGGRTFCATIMQTDAEDYVSLWLRDNGVGDSSGYSITLSAKSAIVTLPDTTEVDVLVQSLTEIRAIPYILGITLNEGYGAYYWISTIESYTPLSTEWEIPAYPSKRVLYVTNQGTFSTVYPVIDVFPEYGGSIMVKNVRMFDVEDWAGEDGMSETSDRFARAAGPLNGAWTTDSGTWALTGVSDPGVELTSGSGVSQTWTLSGLSDAIISCDIYTGNSGSGTSEMLSRRDASVSNTAMYFYFYNGNSVALDEATAGSFNNIYAQGGLTINAGTTYPMVIAYIGQEARFWFDDVQSVMAPTAIANNGNNRLRHGFAHFGSEVALREWRNFKVTPIISDLPLTLQEDGFPFIWTTGSVTNSSAFSGGSTALTSYVPETGGMWTAVEGTWTTDGSGYAEVTGGTERRAYVSTSANIEVSVDVYVSTGTTIMRSGILLWVDSNNYSYIRLFKYPASHDEIEVFQVIGGAAGVILGKSYMGSENFFVEDNTYTLKVQVHGRDLMIYVDDIPWFYGYLDAALASRTAAGLYQENIDDGCIFDSFQVSTIS